jgi:hypothetical protein
MNFVSTGWVLTLCLFALFSAGGIYAFQSISARQGQVAYANCVDRVSLRTNSGREMAAAMSACSYLRGDQITIGKYGQVSGQPLRLAMIDRPNF